MFTFRNSEFLYETSFDYIILYYIILYYIMLYIYTILYYIILYYIILYYSILYTILLDIDDYFMQMHASAIFWEFPSQPCLITGRSRFRGFNAFQCMSMPRVPRKNH